MARKHKPCKRCGRRDLPIRTGLCEVCRRDPEVNPLIECACGCGQTLRKINIASGKEQHYLPNHPSNKGTSIYKEITRATLLELYNERGMGAKEIADALEVSEDYVRRLMDQYHINRRNISQARQAQERSRPCPTEAEMRQLYEEEGLSLPELRTRLHSSFRTIYRLIQEYGIERRSCKEARLLACSQGKYQRNPKISEEQMRRVVSNPYVSTTVDMAQSLSTSRGTVEYYLKKYQLPWPPGRVCDNCKKTHKPSNSRDSDYCSPRCSRLANLNPLPPPSYLPTVYCTTCGTEVKNMTRQRYKNSKGRLFCCQTCLGEWMTEHFSGENNPLWKDGKSRKGYGTKYWQEQRQKALERDNYTCQECGVTQEELDTPLQVHHKIPSRFFKPIRLAHALDNLITLCPLHHGKVEQATNPGQQASDNEGCITHPLDQQAAIQLAMPALIVA